jgi:hypothetical protein
MVIADATDGFIMIASMVPGEKGLHSQAFPVAEGHAAQAYALALSKTHQVYVESALQRTAPPSGRRGTEAGASQFSLVSLDFDGAWGKHAETNLPKSPDELPRVLEAAGAWTPSLVLDTGGGLLALWKLDEALSLPQGDTATRARAKGASKGFQRRIREAATRHFGWKLDGTADLCRLIRIPGTLNHKFDPPRAVRVAV